MSEARRAAAVVRDAGGRIVGRTRLQKTAYLLEEAGLGEGFSFGYKHYGPYSEELAEATRLAALFGLVNETEQPASWGGRYSIYETDAAPDPGIAAARRALAQEAARAGAVELELAATALFLAREGVANAWAETARRKPDKAADGRLDAAQAIYARLRQIATPQPLPDIG
jgi:hypothetical protein